MSFSTLRRRPDAGSFDWAWGGLGVTMAMGSATFAAYMIVTAPAEVTGFGSKDFGIFARFDHRPRAVALAAAHPPLAIAAGTPATGAVLRRGEAPPAPAPTVQPQVTAAIAGLGIDPAPTGSIPTISVAARARASTGVLSDFKLRDVVGDHALIEHRSRLSLVRPGSILADAGEVLAIERQGGGWVVRTAGGVIGGS